MITKKELLGEIPLPYPYSAKSERPSFKNKNHIPDVTKMVDKKPRDIELDDKAFGRGVDAFKLCAGEWENISPCIRNAIQAYLGALPDHFTEVGNMVDDNTLVEVVAAKDAAYAERNLLVAALSRLYPSWLERHSEDDFHWDKEWMNIVYINLPSGQVSWHLHDKDIVNFSHLIWRDNNSWDGHTTDEKYKRLAAIRAYDAAQPPQNKGV